MTGRIFLSQAPAPVGDRSTGTRGGCADLEQS